MKIYRYLTGSDDSSFCHKVTEALQQGWELYGSPSIAINHERVVCGQAVTKDIMGAYNPEKKLSDY